jgi:hypothetical protein
MHNSSLVLKFGNFDTIGERSIALIEDEYRSSGLWYEIRLSLPCVMQYPSTFSRTQTPHKPDYSIIGKRVIHRVSKSVEKDKVSFKQKPTTRLMPWVFEKWF